ncbi:unnamed protein product [Aphanomyces euteiches]
MLCKVNIYLVSTFLLVALLTLSVNGHGRLGDPQPSFVAVDDNTKFSGIINGYNTLPGEKYDDSPQANTDAFNRAFKKSNYQSLKALVDAQGNTGGECGFTRMDGPAQPLPSDGNVKWIHSNEGFVASHEGPCEVWCDNTRVFQNENCARNVPNGVLPIDVSKCQGADRLFFLWLAMHTHEWQVYKNCVPLQGGGGGPRPPSAPSAPSPPAQAKAAPSPSAEYSQASGAKQALSGGGGGGSAATWSQCGGSGYSGPTNCKDSDRCNKLNDWYSQCVPK